MRRQSVSFLILILIGFSLGCSSAARWQFHRARSVEEHGNPQKALAMYESVLEHMPAGDRAWRSEVFFRMGECLWTMDRASEAFALFQKAADLNENHTLARLRLGEIYLAGGAIDRATEQAHAVLRLAGTNSEALALLGAAASVSGDNRLAEAAFMQVLEIDPKRTNIAIALAELYNREDRIPDARAVLAKAAEAQPASAAPWLALGRIEEQEGNTAAAEQAYRKAVAKEDSPESNLRLAQFLQRATRIDEAEQLLQRVDIQRPKLPTALPDFEMTAGRTSRALDRYLIALRSFPPPQPSPKNVWKVPANISAEVAKNRAALAARIIEADLQASKTDQASSDSTVNTKIAALHLAEYRSDLDRATVEMLEAEIALAKDDLPSATTHANDAVALAPESAAAHYVLGVAKHRAGDRRGARTEWLDANTRDAAFVPARLALAAEALRDGDAAGAEQYVVPVIREEPANIRGLNLFARVLLAQKRLDSATVIARRAATVDPKASEPHIIMGDVAVEQRNFGTALVQFEQAILLEPRSKDAIDGLMRVYRRGVVTRPMLVKMETVANNSPPSATLMEIAGRLYAEHGWYGDAQRCLQRAIVLDPQRSGAAAALAEMFAARGKVSEALRSATKAGGNTAALFSAYTAQQTQDLQRAMAEYENAVRQGERTGIAANNLAWLYAQQGISLDRALTLAVEARSLAPKNPAVLDTLGVVHLRRREYTAAIGVLKDAMLMLAGSSAPNQQALWTEVRRHLAEAYLRAGITEDATFIAQAAVARRSRWPNN